jgi:hypothetical protein
MKSLTTRVPPGDRATKLPEDRHVVAGLSWWAMRVDGEVILRGAEVDCGNRRRSAKAVGDTIADEALRDLIHHRPIELKPLASLFAPSHTADQTPDPPPTSSQLIHQRVADTEPFGGHLCDG